MCWQTGDNPKFCVTAKSGANRVKFIMGGRRIKRLPPCLQHNANGTGCQGGAIISPSAIDLNRHYSGMRSAK